MDLDRTLLAVRGIEATSAIFRAELLDLSARLDINPDYLAAVMSFETGGTFDPSIRNPNSKAVGLIQFTKATATRLGTTRDELSNMSAMAQLAYVERYLRPVAGKLHTATDHYMAVFAPSGIGRGPSFALYRQPSLAYEQNQGLDGNNDGTITVDEAAAPVLRIIAAAKQRPRIVVPPIPSPAERLAPLVGAIVLTASAVWLEID